MGPALEELSTISPARRAQRLSAGLLQGRHAFSSWGKSTQRLTVAYEAEKSELLVSHVEIPRLREGEDCQWLRWSARSRPER